MGRALALASHSEVLASCLVLKSLQATDALGSELGFRVPGRVEGPGDLA